MILDIVLILIGAMVVTFSTIEGFGRSLMQLIIFYVVSIIIGMTLLSINITQDMARNIASMLGGSTSRSLFEAWLYLAILIPSTLGIFMLTHFTMDNMKLIKIQWLDSILAVLSGIILALVLMSLISNTWGVIVSTPWLPEKTWLTLRNAYATSALRLPMHSVLSTYRDFLFPFKATRYPMVYTIVN